MDNHTQLALMTKAKLLFEGPGTFLSFPAFQLSYEPGQLDFSQLSGQSTPVFPEFCQLANAIPQGVMFPVLLDSSLWEKYDFVLRNAETAQSTLTLQETADLQEAQAFLYTQEPDGTRVDSQALVAYRQYRQAWIQVMQNYASRKSTAEASTDPNVQAQWQTVDEPSLRADIQAAENAWDTAGFKTQAEQAQEVEWACAAKSPDLQWESWRKAFNPDIDVLTWPSTGVRYALTSYSPFDILAQPHWPTFTLTGSEIEQLVSEAPAELANIFGPSTADPSISSLSFEFCSVTLNRPWYNRDLFNARFWRLPDPAIQFSDGMIPPHGQCPAYIAGLVFARNIVVTNNSGTGTTTPTRIYDLFQIVPRHSFILPAPPGTVTQRRFLAERAEPDAVAASPAEVSKIETMVPGALAPQPLPSAAISPKVIGRLNLGRFGAIPMGTIEPPSTESGPEPSPPAAPAPSNGDEQQPSDSVSIFAFICEWLPKCPNPDQALKWGS
jgi:hypothetical protein